MTFDDFAEYVLTDARLYRNRFTRPDDDWPIRVSVLYPGEAPHSFDMPGWISNDHSAKRVLARVLALVTKEAPPRFVALTTSAWVVERDADSVTDHDDPLGGVRPSEHPDRYEALQVLVLDPEIARTWRAKIKRRRYGPPLLGEWDADDRRTEIGGAMFEPLRQAFR